MPCFQTGVKKVFDKKKICWDKNPDYAVALGLGMYASMLNKNAKSSIGEILLKEQTTMTLGVGLNPKVADDEEIVEIDVVLIVPCSDRRNRRCTTWS